MAAPPRLLLLLLLLLLLDRAAAEPDPVETDDEDEPDAVPAPGGHWHTAAEAQEVCASVCTKAYPECDLIGCVPRRKDPTVEGCQISCCGDTSHKFCWNCVELGPGETPPDPPATCKPTGAQQSKDEADAAKAKALSLKPPPPDAPLAGDDPNVILEHAEKKYLNKPDAPDAPAVPGAQSPPPQNSNLGGPLGGSPPTASSLPSGGMPGGGDGGGSAGGGSGSGIGGGGGGSGSGGAGGGSGSGSGGGGSGGGSGGGGSGAGGGGGGNGGGGGGNGGGGGSGGGGGGSGSGGSGGSDNNGNFGSGRAGSAGALGAGSAGSGELEPFVRSQLSREPGGAGLNTAQMLS